MEVSRVSMIVELRSAAQQITTIAAMTAQEGIKTRLVPLVVGVLLVGILLAGFVGNLAVIEAGQIRCAVLGSYLRLVGVLVIALFVLNAQAREFHDKGLEWVLALPVPRSHYLLGKMAGFSGVALGIALLFSVTLSFYTAIDRVALWGISFFFEQMIVIALSLFCLLTFSQLPTAFTAVLAVYLLSRALTSLILVGQGPIMPQFVIVNWLMNRVMDGLAFVLPALDRFTNVEWLVYGTGTVQDLSFVVGQGLIYLVLLTLAALVDFYRKNL